MTRTDFLLLSARFYDNGDWFEADDGHYILGLEGWSERRNEEDGPDALSSAEIEAMRWIGALMARQSEHQDRLAAESRTTLRRSPAPSFEPPPNPEVTAAIRQSLAPLINSLPQGVMTQVPALHDPVTASRLLRHFTQELVKLIPVAADRAERLSEISGLRGDIPKTVADLFEVAHRCHLYGLDVPCIAICRALIEEALQRRVDPGGSRCSWPSLVDLARQECGRCLRKVYCQSAIRVIRAGNDALHDPATFSERYSVDDVSGFIVQTRSIILSMYGAR